MAFLTSEDAIDGKNIEVKLGDTLSHCFSSKLPVLKCPGMVQNGWVGRKEGGKGEEASMLEDGKWNQMACNATYCFCEGILYLSIYLDR